MHASENSYNLKHYECHYLYSLIWLSPPPDNNRLSNLLLSRSSQFFVQLAQIIQFRPVVGITLLQIGSYYKINIPVIPKQFSEPMIFSFFFFFLNNLT